MIVAASFVAMAVWWATMCPAADRLQRVLPRRAGDLREHQRAPASWSAPVVVAAGAGLVTGWLVGGALGWLLAPAVGLVAHRWVTGLESAEQKRRRDRLARDLPTAVDLMVAALEAGRPPSQAVTAAARAVGGPVEDELNHAVARLGLGADPVTVWEGLATRPGMAPLGRALARSARTGAPAGSVLGRCVDDLRNDRRAVAQQRARAVGVQTAGPLGLCFLPAFVLVGIVPTVVGAVQHLGF